MRTLIIVSIAVCICTAHVIAAEVPVMAFTNTQISANIEFPQIETTGNYGGDPGELDNRFGTPFDDSTAFLPNQATYIGQDLYGGGERVMYDITQAFDGIKRSRAQANTGWRFDVRSTSNCSWHAVCLMYVKKADFYNDGDTKAVSITDSSTFTAQANNEFYYANRDGFVRPVVKIGSTFYISEKSNEFEYSTSPITYNFTGLNSSGWAVYDPATELLFDSSSASYSTIDLSSVDAVGMYFREQRIAPNVANVQWKIWECSVQANVIPEPGTFIALLGVAGLIAYRRKN